MTRSYLHDEVVAAIDSLACNR